jgi:hypothetical protein
MKACRIYLITARLFAFFKIHPEVNFTAENKRFGS